MGTGCGAPRGPCANVRLQNRRRRIVPALYFKGTFQNEAGKCPNSSASTGGSGSLILEDRVFWHRSLSMPEVPGLSF
jgi:hypothetical protein